MRMKSQLSLIISFQVETSLTIVLFLLLSSYYYPTMISAEQGGGGYVVSYFLANMLSAGILVFLFQCYTVNLILTRFYVLGASEKVAARSKKKGTTVRFCKRSKAKKKKKKQF